MWFLEIRKGGYIGRNKSDAKEGIQQVADSGRLVDVSTGHLIRTLGDFIQLLRNISFLYSIAVPV